MLLIVDQGGKNVRYSEKLRDFRRERWRRLQNMGPLLDRTKQTVCWRLGTEWEGTILAGNGLGHVPAVSTLAFSTRVTCSTRWAIEPLSNQSDSQFADDVETDHQSAPKEANRSQQGEKYRCQKMLSVNGLLWYRLTWICFYFIKKQQTLIVMRDLAIYIFANAKHVFRLFSWLWWTFVFYYILSETRILILFINVLKRGKF